MEEQGRRQMKRKRPMGGGREIEQERYLCLGSDHHIFCIDLDATERRHGRNCRFLVDEEAVPEAVIIWNINTEDQKPRTLPFTFGMRSTDFNFKNPNSSSRSNGSRIYLIGGEDADRDYWLDRGNKIFEVIPEALGEGDEITLSMKEDESIPRMKSEKANPVIEEIDGKLYVLHTYYATLDNDMVPQEPFEVFDGQIREWKALKKPEFFNRREDEPEYGSFIVRHTVIGHRLFVLTCTSFIYSFDTKTESWSDSQFDYLPFPMKCCFYFGQLNNKELYLGITIVGDEPMAHVVSTDGEIIASQCLPQLFDGVRPACPRFALDDGVLIPMVSHEADIVRMTACTVVQIATRPALAISIFRMFINRHCQRLILQNVKDESLCSKFLQVEVERTFILRDNFIPYGLCALNGPAFYL